MLLCWHDIWLCYSIQYWLITMATLRSHIIWVLKSSIRPSLPSQVKDYFPPYPLKPTPFTSSASLCPQNTPRPVRKIFCHLYHSKMLPRYIYMYIDVHTEILMWYISTNSSVYWLIHSSVPCSLPPRTNWIIGIITHMMVVSRPKKLCLIYLQSPSTEQALPSSTSYIQTTHIHTTHGQFMYIVL